jgi:hypothetical protein
MISFLIASIMFNPAHSYHPLNIYHPMKTLGIYRRVRRKREREQKLIREAYFTATGVCTGVATKHRRKK